VIALFGLRQMRLMKADILARSERAAKEKALEMCHEYLIVYPPISDVFTREYEKKGLKPYTGPIGDFSSESIPSEWRENAEARGNLYSYVAPLNKLESIAATFLSGVGDEQTAFKIIGQLFSFSVEAKYDVICRFRMKGLPPMWPSIVQLYRLWSARLAREKLEAEKERMDTQYEERTQALRRRIGQIPDTSVPPLGPKDI